MIKACLNIFLRNLVSRFAVATKRETRLTKVMDIVFSCITWFRVLLRRMFKLAIPTMVVDLPCDIIVDIFSRVPADLVFQCRHEWGLLQTLTSHQSFIDMHFERAGSMILKVEPYCPDRTSILVERNQECSFRVHLIDDRGKIVFSKYLKVDFSYVSWDGIRLFDSHNGLLLFESAKYLILWNPATEDKAIVKKMDSGYSYPCGFFMDTIAQECKFIFVISVDSRFQFKLLNLRTKSSRSTKSFSHPPYNKSPVILEGSMYWFVDKTRFRSRMGSPLGYMESIVVLDIYSENICTIAQPVEIDEMRAKGGLPQLMNLGKHLCFVDGSIYPTMDIWVMEDFTRKFWFRKHTINLQFPGTPFDGCYRFTTIKSDEDDLLLTYLGVLYRHNLKLKTWRVSKLQRVHLFFVYKTSLVPVHDGRNT